MTYNISDIVLISDLDGTLLNSNRTISKVNIDKLKSFTRLGGKFTVATGRTAKSAEYFVSEIGVHQPGIVLNGAMIYDFANKKVLWQKNLPLCVKQICNDILLKFPDIAVELVCGQDIFLLNDNEFSKIQSVSDDYFIKIKTLDSVPDEVNKLVFAGIPERISELSEYIESLNISSIHGMNSCSHLYEVLPMNTDKGTALIKLCELTNQSINSYFAIGDYDNDAEMLKKAFVSAAPAGSSENAAESADYICKNNCTNGAVAEFIDYIINNYTDKNL